MKKISNLSKVVCALGVSTIMLTGVASANDMQPMNTMHNQPSQTMMMPGMGNGVGSVMPGMKSTQIDYVGAVTMLHRYYPSAMVTSISYDAKHHPTYEVEAYTKTQKIEMKFDEATGQVIENEAKPIKNTKKMRSFNPQNTIIPEGAETKAIERVGSEFQTMEWELSMEGNKVVYELEMTNGANKKAEVKVDAMTGQIISSKVKTTKH